jgi:hypothetical protein
MTTPTRRTRQSKHVSDSTTQVGQDHVATGVLMDLGTNNHQNLPENAAERATQAVPDLQRSVRSLSPVRPVTPGTHIHDLTDSTERSYTSQAGTAHRLGWYNPGNPKSKNPTSRALKHSKIETTASLEIGKHTQTFTQAKLNKGLAPVRSVEGTGHTGQVFGLSR